ncbi:MAG TPA: prolyl aminopeptidase [Acidobacteriota bacterium]|nr:prolyl aminopeptidase [Acidobacteriota bacterium]
MKRVRALASILVALFLVNSCAEENQSELYPVHRLLKSGYLQVSDVHSLYWEVRGAENGIPVIVLHGGPGASATKESTCFFEPGKYRIILFDQRGAGRSKPAGEWRDNNTKLLIEDINRIREHLGVEGKALIFGGSWGSTLALAYAEAYPDLVSGLILRGIFLGTKAEADHYWHGGTALFFPDNFDRFRSMMPEPESMDYHRQIFKMTQSDDVEVRKNAVRGALLYGFRMMVLGMPEEEVERIVDSFDGTAMVVLDCHYSMNSYFLEEGQLMRDAGKIAHIPTFITNGRFDLICPPRAAILLAKKFDCVKLEIVNAAHVQSEPEIRKALAGGVKWVTGQVEAK